MFSVRQKREIAAAVQKVLRATAHPELPEGEIRFLLQVDGAEPWSWGEGLIMALAIVLISFAAGVGVVLFIALRACAFSEDDDDDP